MRPQTGEITDNGDDKVNGPKGSSFKSDYTTGEKQLLAQPKATYINFAH